MKKLTKLELETKDLDKLLGGAPTPAPGCWCTCRCFEATVVGFQLGNMANVKTGQIPSTK